MPEEVTGIERKFFRAMAACAAVSALCVLVAQIALTGYPSPSSRSEAILLYNDPVYVLQRWTILGQVVLMFLALWGVTLKSLRSAPGLIATGAVFFIFWQVLELIPRGVEMITLARIWAPRYAEADTAMRAGLETYFAVFADVSAGLGTVRRVVWMLGHLLFGLVLWRGRGLQRIVGALFLLNFVRLFPRVVGELAGWSWLAGLIRGPLPFVAAMVPLFAVIALWLWREPRMLPARRAATVGR